MNNPRGLLAALAFSRRWQSKRLFLRCDRGVEIRYASLSRRAERERVCPVSG